MAGVVSTSHLGLSPWDWGPQDQALTFLSSVLQMHKRERTCKDYIKVRGGKVEGCHRTKVGDTRGYRGPCGGMGSIPSPSHCG